MGRIIDTKLIEQFVKRMDELEEKIDALTEFYTDRGEEAVVEAAKDNLNRMLKVGENVSYMSNSQVDWERRRYELTKEVAKATIKAVLSNAIVRLSDIPVYKDKIVNITMGVTDDIIDKLKK
jgi:hypothetical protein